MLLGIKQRLVEYYKCGRLNVEWGEKDEKRMRKDEKRKKKDEKGREKGNDKKWKSKWTKRSGAGEAWRAHNSQVGGSKPLSAKLLFLPFLSFFAFLLFFISLSFDYLIAFKPTDSSAFVSLSPLLHVDVCVMWCGRAVLSHFFFLFICECVQKLIFSFLIFGVMSAWQKKATNRSVCGALRGWLSG